MSNRRKLIGWFLVVIGIVNLIVLHHDLTNHIYSWRLINIIVSPINIVTGILVLKNRFWKAL